MGPPAERIMMANQLIPITAAEALKAACIHDPASESLEVERIIERCGGDARPRWENRTALWSALPSDTR